MIIAFHEVADLHWFHPPPPLEQAQLLLRHQTWLATSIRMAIPKIELTDAEAKE
jgi:hypothetical protein